MNYKFKPDIIPTPKIGTKAKSITDLVNTTKYKTIEAAFLHFEPNEKKKSTVALAVGEKLEVIDFEGRFVKVRATGANGKARVAWILIKKTNINYNELLYNRLTKNIKSYAKDMTGHADEHRDIAIEDYKKKKPGAYVQTFDDLPTHVQENAQMRTYDPFVEREAKELASKRELSGAFLADMQKVYSFDKIFDPEKMQADQALPEKERRFANAKNGEVSFDVGYRPDYADKEDVHDYLDMGEQMTATMEVLYNPEPKGKNEVDKITLNYPLTYFINNIEYRSEEDRAKFNLPLKDKVTDKIGLMAIMVTHEYIHTAQNTMLHFQDIARLPNLKDAKDIERRKTMREILAHHHSVFPNKEFNNSKDDPVFTGTEFVRGKTAVYDKQSDWVQAFLVWMVLDYIKRYEKVANATLSKKYKLAELKADFTVLKEDLAARLNIDFSKTKEGFKAHLIALVKEKNGELVLPEEKLTPRQLKAIKEAADKKASKEKGKVINEGEIPETKS